MRKLALTLTLALVLAAAATAATTGPAQLSISASKPVVVYGRAVRIAGAMPRRGGEPVTVSIRRHGESAFLPVSDTSTDASGTWSFSFEPTVSSQLQARSNQNVSRVVTVRVRPRLTLRRRGGALFARAVAARSYRGRHVWLQRRTKQGRWHSVRKVVLDDPPRRFNTELPKGTSRVRISLSRRQAGPGYEPAVSRVLTIRR